MISHVCHVLLNMNEVTIQSFSGLSLPADVFVCDLYGNQCKFLGSIGSLPTTLTLPTEFNTAPALGLKINDGICEKFETIICT